MSHYRHIVFFSFVEPIAENTELVRKQLLSLEGKIPGLISLEVGVDDVGSERSCHLCLNTLFETKEAAEAYQTDPAHVAVVKVIKPTFAKTCSADYFVN